MANTDDNFNYQRRMKQIYQQRISNNVGNGMAPRRRRTKPRKNMVSEYDYLMENLSGGLLHGGRRSRRTPKRMPSKRGGCGAGGKKCNPWISHVKKVAKQQGLSYKDAMIVASRTY